MLADIPSAGGRSFPLVTDSHIPPLRQTAAIWACESAMRATAPQNVAPPITEGIHRTRTSEGPYHRVEEGANPSASVATCKTPALCRMARRVKELRCAGSSQLQAGDRHVTGRPPFKDTRRVRADTTRCSCKSPTLGPYIQCCFSR